MVEDGPPVPGRQGGRLGLLLVLAVVTQACSQEAFATRNY